MKQIFTIISLMFFTFSIAEAQQNNISLNEFKTQNPDLDHFHSIDNHHYFIKDELISWTDAKNYGDQIGVSMYIINSSDEENEVYASLPLTDGFGYLLGLYQDINDPNYSEPSGGWKWVDGTSLTYSNWSDNEPNDDNGGGENYAHFGWQGNGIYWNDIKSSPDVNKPIYEFVSSSADILLNGTVSAENNQIKNVADPTDPQDVTTKSYVDSNVNSFSGSYTDLTDKPIIYTQSEVDDLMSSLLSDLDSLGSIIESLKTFVNYYEIDNSPSSTVTASGKFIYGMGSNEYEISGYYSFDPASKTFSQTDLNPYIYDSSYRWTKPAVSGNGKVFEFSGETAIVNVTENITSNLPGGYKAYTYYDYVNGFDSNVSSALFLVRTDSMNEHGVHIAYFDDQDNVQILDPGFEFRGGMENMSHEYEDGYFFITKYGVNNPYEYYVINFNAQTPEAVKINFPSTDSNSRPYSKTYAGDGKFYLSYQKNNSDYYSKTILLLDTESGETSEIFTTSSGAAHLTMASNKKLYYHNNYGNNNDNNIHVYDPTTNIHSLIAPPEGGTNVTLFATYGKTVEMNGKLILRYFFSGYEVQNARERLYELDIQTETLNEINPNGVLDNYQYKAFYGPYNDSRVYNQPSNPMFIYDGKLYVIFRGTSDYGKHYIMIYDGVSAELVDPEQVGGLKSFVEMMDI